MYYFYAKEKLSKGNFTHTQILLVLISQDKSKQLVGNQGRLENLESCVGITPKKVKLQALLHKELFKQLQRLILMQDCLEPLLQPKWPASWITVFPSFFLFFFLRQVSICNSNDRSHQNPLTLQSLQVLSSRQ